MLGKLLKDEVKSYRFSMGITFLAGAVFTMLMKIMCMLPYHSDMRGVVQSLSFFAFYYVIFAVAFAAQILIVVRFYQTMVGDRGYLTWTLPAKSTTILWSKLIGGGFWYILSMIVVIVCFAVFVFGGYWVDDVGEIGEMMQEFQTLFTEIGEMFEIKYLIPVVLYVLAMIFWSMFSFMLLYLCIAIGQLFGKWRILASIGTYFVIMFILYVVMVIIMFVFIGSGAVLFRFVDKMDGFALFNLVLGVFCLFGAAGFAGGFAITNGIFSKHLNLE